MMKYYKLVFYRNLLFFTLLFGIGHQTLISSYSDTFTAKHIKVNFTENIYGIDIEIQDFDQAISAAQKILLKKIISNNFLHENNIFLTKIDLNSWKPPKV